MTSVALAPKVRADQTGVLYEGHDYAGMGRAADYCLLMTYEWGYTYGAVSYTHLPGLGDAGDRLFGTK